MADILTWQLKSSLQLMFTVDNPGVKYSFWIPKNQSEYIEEDDKNKSSANKVYPKGIITHFLNTLHFLPVNWIQLNKNN